MGSGHQPSKGSLLRHVGRCDKILHGLILTGRDTFCPRSRPVFRASASPAARCEHGKQSGLRAALLAGSSRHRRFLSRGNLGDGSGRLAVWTLACQSPRNLSDRSVVGRFASDLSNASLPATSGIKARFGFLVKLFFSRFLLIVVNLTTLIAWLDGFPARSVLLEVHSMAALAPYIPSRDSMLANWLTNFSTLLTASPATYGQSSATASAVATAVAAWSAAYALVTSPSTKTAMTVAAKNTERSTCSRSVARRSVDIP